jgi:hypothetical protein
VYIILDNREKTNQNCGENTTKPREFWRFFHGFWQDSTAFEPEFDLVLPELLAQ